MPVETAQLLGWKRFYALQAVTHLVAQRLQLQSQAAGRKGLQVGKPGAELRQCAVAVPALEVIKPDREVKNALVETAQGARFCSPERFEGLVADEVLPLIELPHCQGKLCWRWTTAALRERGKVIRSEGAAAFQRHRSRL